MPAITVIGGYKKVEHYFPVASHISGDWFRDLPGTSIIRTPLGSPNHDRVGEERPVVSHNNIVATNLKGAYNPNMEVAVDEAMIKFQGRSSLKRYIPQYDGE